MTLFHFRDTDEKLAENATHMDDVDLVHSKLFTGPWGPCLVVVAMHGGVHVCWRCGEQFDEERRKFRAVEVKHGTSYILLHAKCVQAQRLTSARSVDDIIRGLQVRRSIATIARASSGVAAAASEGATVSEGSPIILPPK